MSEQPIRPADPPRAASAASAPPALGDRWFRALIENGPDGVVLVGADARVLYASHSLERTFGRSSDEILGSGGLDWVDPRDQERMARLFSELVSVPDAVATAELRVQREDGSIGWVEATGRNLLHDPEVQAVMVTVHEIDARKRVEEELRRAAAMADSSDQQYRRLFEQNPIPMWVYDPETLRFLKVNEAAVAHYGYSRPEFLAMSLLDIRPAEDAERLREALGADSDGDWRHRLKDGSVIDVQIQSHTLTMRGVEARLVIATDITNRRRAEEELRRAFQAERAATNRLRALDEMKNVFLTAVSHELRTPLSAVLGSALTLERLGGELSEEERADLIHAVTANARKLEVMLGDLLDLDRLTRGVIRPRSEQTELASLVRGVVEEPEFQVGRRIEVETHPMVIKVDPPKVQRIVENLLANAIRHTPDGTPIWVRVRRIPEGAQIDVEDAGPGVPPEMREAVFEPFRQGENRNPHSPGFGIGLSLVKRFAELHGGRVWVEERPGGGAAFHVVLREPTAPAQNERS